MRHCCYLWCQKPAEVEIVDLATRIKVTSCREHFETLLLPIPEYAITLIEEEKEELAV